MEKVNLDTTYMVTTAMLAHGGSFVKALGRALQCADAENIIKIKDTWPEYWKKYLDMATTMPEFKEWDF